MKKLSLLLAVLLTLSSCETVDGQLKVEKSFDVNKQYGLFNRKTQKVKIDQDVYDASLKLSSKKKLTLELSGGSVGKLSIPIKSEENLKIPAYDGEFRISHDEINQPFDIEGALETYTRMSDVMRGSRMCSWDIYERQCNQYGCQDVKITIQGIQDYEWSEMYTTRTVSLKILKKDSRDVAATFNGSSYDTTKMENATGPCRSF